MIDPKLLGDIAKDHARNTLSKEEAKAFLLEFQALCEKHEVFLRTSDNFIRFSRRFADSDAKTRFGAVIDKDGKCEAAKIILK